MKPLSEASLTAARSTGNTSMKTDIAASTYQLGLTTEDGRMITVFHGQTVLDEGLRAIPHTTLCKQSLQKSTMDVREKNRQIAHLIQQCYDSQDTYGKTAKQLETLMRMMISALSEYDLPEVQEAFAKWQRQSEKIPTVCGILDCLGATKPEKPDVYYVEDPDGKHLIAGKNYSKAFGLRMTGGRNV